MQLNSLVQLFQGTLLTKSPRIVPIERTPNWRLLGICPKWRGSSTDCVRLWRGKRTSRKL